MTPGLRLLSAPGALLLVLSMLAPAVAVEEPDRLWLVGERAFADGLYPLARRVLERFVKDNPRDRRAPDAMFLLGKTRLALGDAEGALEVLRRAQAVTPPPSWKLEARFWEAEALFRLKRYAEARSAYDDIIRTNAASRMAPDALYGVAFCDLELQQQERAVNEFTEFLRTWPTHAQVPSATFYVGRTLVELKRYSEAVPLLASFTAKYPAHKLAPDARYLLGWTRVTTGDPRGGVADLRAFVAANPAHPQVPAAQRMIVETLSRHGDRDELLEVYRVFMTQQPPTVDGLSDAAGIAGRLGRAADQEAAWRKLRASFPEHRLARRAGLDLANLAFQRKDWKEAAALAQSAAASDDEAVRAEAWLLTGESELKLKRYPAALRAFDAVTNLEAVEPGVRYRALAGAGVAHEAQQEWGPALTAYEEVASNSVDETLRDWAKDRVAEVKSHLAKPAPAKPAPPAKPTPKARPEKPGAKPGGRP